MPMSLNNLLTPDFFSPSFYRPQLYKGLLGSILTTSAGLPVLGVPGTSLCSNSRFRRTKKHREQSLLFPGSDGR